MELNDLKKTLAGLIGELKPAPFIPDETIQHETVEFDGTEKDNSKWLSYMTDALKTASSFEIHCWNEETVWIELALRYGSLKDTDWRYGKIIAGGVTPEFVRMLLKLPKPADIEIYNKMTPFFTIALDNDFWSEHYGTQLNLVRP